MIKYTIKCCDGHVFDGWFSNSLAFDDQKAAGLVSCPFCGENDVEKALMTPSVTGTKMQGELVEAFDSNMTTGTPSAEGEVVDVMPTTIPEPLIHGDDTVRAVVAKMRELRSWVESNVENVGDRFAEKAREMHYGEEEKHGIFGKATFEEAQELIDEGVDFLPLPGLPEDNN